MTAGTVAVLLAGLAGLLTGGPAEGARRRLSRLTAPSASRVGGPPWPGRWLPRLAAAGAGLAALGGVGSAAVVLAVLAGVTGLSAARRLRLEREARAATARDLPRAADLLASALAAGATPPAAVAAVADAVGGPLGGRLRPVAAALAGGWEPPIGASGDGSTRLVRALVRATATGAPLADTVRAVADDERERARWAALERARTAGVRAVGPLAACFLPAFVLVGVVPVVAGIARELLEGWA